PDEDGSPLDSRGSRGRHARNAQRTRPLACRTGHQPGVESRGGCRPTSLTMSVRQDPADVVCVDWSSRQAGGTVAGYNLLATNAADIVAVSAVPSIQAMDLTAGVEYFAFQLTVDHALTVGAGSCSGCNVPVCIVLNSITVDDAGGGTRYLTLPAAPGSD